MYLIAETVYIEGRNVYIEGRILKSKTPNNNYE